MRLGDLLQTEWSAALAALFPVGMAFAEEVEAGRRSFDEWKPLLLKQEAVVAWWDAHRRGQ